MQDNVLQFVAHCRATRVYAEHTLVAYTQDLTQFNTFIHESYSLTSIIEVRHLHIRAWVVSMLRNQIEPRTVRRKLSALKALFKHLIARDIVQRSQPGPPIDPRFCPRNHAHPVSTRGTPRAGSRIHGTGATAPPSARSSGRR